MRPNTDAEHTKVSFCIPLVTRDDVLGILFLTTVNGEEINSHERILATTVAERWHWF